MLIGIEALKDQFAISLYEHREQLCEELEHAVAEHTQGGFSPEYFQLFLRRFLEIGLVTSNDFTNLFELKAGTVPRWLRDSATCPSGGKAREICNGMMALQRQRLAISAPDFF